MAGTGGLDMDDPTADAHVSRETSPSPATSGDVSRETDVVQPDDETPIATVSTWSERTTRAGRAALKGDARGARALLPFVGPAVIGAGSVITDSYIGPSTSVAENCRITESEIEFSIVLRDSSFDRIRRVEASLIGRNVQVTLAPRLPAAHRFVIGDHGRVQIPS